MTQDKFGREVKPGDLILYGHMIGRSAGTRVGRVRRISAQGRLIVRGLDDDTPWEVQPNLKDGVLRFPERAVVIPDGLAPAWMLKMLEPFGPKEAGRA